jgi:hypothetical protein
MQTDGRTDMTKLIVAFRNYAKAAKTYVHARCSLHFYRAFWGVRFSILWSLRHGDFFAYAYTIYIVCILEQYIRT